MINAGGGTVDISTYKVLSNGPLRVEELYEPKCELDPSCCRFSRSTTFILGLILGGELVTARARAMIRGAF